RINSSLRGISSRSTGDFHLVTKYSLKSAQNQVCLFTHQTIRIGFRHPFSNRSCTVHIKLTERPHTVASNQRLLISLNAPDQHRHCCSRLNISGDNSCIAKKTSPFRSQKSCSPKTFSILRIS